MTAPAAVAAVARELRRHGYSRVFEVERTVWRAVAEQGRNEYAPQSDPFRP